MLPLTVKRTGADQDHLIQPIERIYQNDLVHHKSLLEIVDPHQDVVGINPFLVSSKSHLRNVRIHEIDHQAIGETQVPTTEMYINHDVTNS